MKEEVLTEDYCRAIYTKTFATLTDPNSSSSTSGGTQGSVSYGSKTYKTVKIGEQWWMAENLAIDIPGSVCYQPSIDCWTHTALRHCRAAST